MEDELHKAESDLSDLTVCIYSDTIFNTSSHKVNIFSDKEKPKSKVSEDRNQSCTKVFHASSDDLSLV
jgi:hypothetical protein